VDVVPLPQSGGCLCGAVRYQLTGAPLLAYACHCHDCQTRSGAAFTLTLVVRSADVALAGPLDLLSRVSRSGREIDQGFCPHCRIKLFATAPVAPEYMSLPAGALDDASWVRPIAQTFVKSALPWAIIPGVRQMTWDEFDFVAQGQQWMATAPRFEAG
jgi:hypothetical protein